ncbi:MAG: hypothetical protein Q9N26_08230 [Aquificota bacterium]|nr:hypothetical protein [Aquificota bacterium]
MGEVIRGVNFPSYLIASFLAGYAMLGVDIMLDGFLGLFGTYRDYMEVMEGWGVPEEQVFLLMAVGHQINSFLLGIFFAHPAIYSRIPSGGLIKGLIFGFVWNVLVFLVAIPLYLGGAEFMGLILKDPLSLTLLHMIWGGVLGLLYSPPRSL